MRKVILAVICLFSVIHAKAQYFDTLQLHYDIGAYQLNNRDKQALDSVAANLSNSKILIYAYADYLGTENPNLLLSEKRAKTALQYLLGKGFPEKNVMQCIGSGQVAVTKENEERGDAKSRRTDIFIIKPKAAAANYQTETPIQEPASRPTNNSGVTSIDFDAIKVGDTINLQNVGFYPGMKLILPSSYPEVDHLIEVLKSHPTLRIRLEGHVCCCVYPDGYFENTPHWRLSVARAKELRDVLVKHGISPERLEYTGFGRSHPILDNEQTSEQGQVNRRVEIRILAK